MQFFAPHRPVLTLLAVAFISAYGAVSYAQAPSGKNETTADARTAAVTPEQSPKAAEVDAPDAPQDDRKEKSALQSNEPTQNSPDAADLATPDAADAPAIPAHPVIVALVKKLTQSPELHKAENKDDIAAIGTYFTAEPDHPVWTSKDGFTQVAKEAVAEIRKAGDWGLKVTDFDLPNLNVSSFTTEAQAEAELKVSIAVLKYARFARGGRIKPSAVSRLFDQAPEIADPAMVLSSISNSKDPARDLREFHPKHPQFERLRQALLDVRRKNKETAAKIKEKESEPAKIDGEPGDTTTADGKSDNASKPNKEPKKSAKSKKEAEAKPAASALKLIANMERWRWVPRNLGDFYVWDDVPAQMTSIVDDGKVVLKEKMVVGKPSTPTPMFSAPMQYIIFHPSWGVPPGMKRNELGPQLRNTGGGWFSTKPLASAVLRSHGLRVTRNGHPIDPDSVDWSSANVSNYHFTQPPGPTNVLGIVKFRFPNKHNVYMHDTPERHLFNGRARTFSHGCMRVQNPIHFAEVLLKHDKGWDPGRVKTAKQRGENIELSNPIPVHVAYFTVEVDDDGTVEVHRDIYGLDNRTASKIEGHRTRVGGPAVAGKKSTKRKRTYSRKKKKRKPKKKPFNPFASLAD